MLQQNKLLVDVIWVFHLILILTTFVGYDVNSHKLTTRWMEIVDSKK